MTKEFILGEIRRTARDGVPLGHRAFATATGIKEHDWRGKLWARWGDAVNEAGFEARAKQERHPEELIFDKILALTEKLGHFPAISEMQMERVADSSFPNNRSIFRRYDRKTLLDSLIAYSAKDKNWSELGDKLLEALPTVTETSGGEQPGTVGYGHVYLIRAENAFKIGCSRSVYSRTATVVRQSPYGGELIHTISTDDPEGIERYWHERFKSSRIVGNNKTSGEWFSLSAADVSTFKRRKTM